MYQIKNKLQEPFVGRTFISGNYSVQTSMKSEDIRSQNTGADLSVT